MSSWTTVFWFTVLISWSLSLFNSYRICLLLTFFIYFKLYFSKETCNSPSPRPLYLLRVWEVACLSFNKMDGYSFHLAY